jgi:hypothetical protein
MCWYLLVKTDVNMLKPHTERTLCSLGELSELTPHCPGVALPSAILAGLAVAGALRAGALRAGALRAGALRAGALGADSTWKRTWNRRPLCRPVTGDE